MFLQSLIISTSLLIYVTVAAQANHIPFRNCLNEASYYFYEEMYDSAFVYFEKAEKFGYDFYPMEAHLYSRTLWEVGKKINR